jgi:hypothetical protein
MAVAKEIRSFAVLNVAWTSLAKLLTAIPQQWRASALDRGLLAQVLRCVLGYMGHELQQAGALLYDANRLQVGGAAPGPLLLPPRQAPN